MKEKVETVSYITPSREIYTGRNIDAYPGSMYSRAAEGIHINNYADDDDYMLHKIYTEAYGENTKPGKGKRGGKK
jgi:hypothetical protein